MKFAQPNKIAVFAPIPRAGLAIGLWCLLAGCSNDPTVFVNDATADPDARVADIAEAGTPDQLLDADAPTEPGRFVPRAAIALAADRPTRHPESVVGGIGLFDADADGDLDMIVGTVSNVFFFQNNGSGDFEDATASAGLDALNGGHGLARGDIDRDGDIDLIVGSPTATYVLVNDGSAHFDDRSDDWGLNQHNDFRASLALGDYDQDGFVDLYETGYINLQTEGLDAIVVGLPNRLYRNTGSVFELVDTAPGDYPAPTLAANWLDFDRDGRLDLWVVNDYGHWAVPNQLYINRSDDDLTQFSNVASALGYDVALFGMTATWADFDNDGDLDTYVTNIGNNVLLVTGPNGAVDRAADFGVQLGTFPDPVPAVDVDPPWPPHPQESNVSSMNEMIAPFCEAYCATESGEWVLTGFSALFLDADQDGWQDLFVVNGAVGIDPVLPEGRGQYNVFFRNLEGRGFERLDADQFPVIRGDSRGAATGDIDGDGDLDLVFVDNGYRTAAPSADLRTGPAVHVVENQLASGNWLRIELMGRDSNRDVVGAWVTVVTSDGQQHRHYHSSQGYASFGQRDAHFGLGETVRVDRITVSWPGGATTVLEDVDVNQRIQIEQP